ncbi:hypothetical protein ES705_35157 [subsurface metagenome]
MTKAGRNGWDRCFHGTIKRLVDSEGNPVVYGKIKVLNDFISAQASNQDVLGKNLDELVLMRCLGLYWITNILHNFRKDKSYKKTIVVFTSAYSWSKNNLYI